MANLTPSTESVSSHGKRNRVQLSCTPCRHAKLKCDRAQPCSQCRKKDRVASCVYPAPVPRKKAAMSMQKRLKHLENLVRDVMKSQAGEGQGSHTPPCDDQERGGGDIVSRAAALGISAEVSGGSMVDASSSSVLGGSVESRRAEVVSGQVVFGGRETQYVGATHWAAIFDDIGEVKEYFDQGEDEDIEEETEPDVSLIFNADVSPTKAGLLAALPSRRVVDKILQGYFHGGNPSLHILHAPTFQKEYLNFWANPHDTPLAWLGLLYGVMCLSLLSTYAAGEDKSDERASAMQTMRAYRRNCIQCIHLSDYTKPGKYTIEAILAHLEGEFILSDADQVNCYALLGVAVRLALRMGIHRDPDKVGGKMTPFEGEMRRRLWNILRQIDLLASFHIGLPSMVESIDSDVELPRNLNDADFDEYCMELPPSKPDSEVTSMSYIRFKSRICHVFGQIATHANSLTPPSYDQIMNLDTQLNSLHAAIPPPFQLRPINTCIADPSHLIIQRINIAHLLHKSRCVLHRKHLLDTPNSPSYEYSVRAGLHAAMQLLDLQQQTYDATQPDGVLSHDRCFPSSLSMHDFLLAAMIVYMRTMKMLDVKSGGSPLAPADQKLKSDMIAALKVSCHIWHRSLFKYPETRRAADVLDVMVRKIGEGSTSASDGSGVSSIGSWDLDIQTETGMDNNSPTGFSSQDPIAVNQIFASASSLPPTQTSTSNFWTPDINPEDDTLDFDFDFPSANPNVNPNPNIPQSWDHLMNIPTDFDWDIFDSQVRF